MYFDLNLYYFGAKFNSFFLNRKYWYSKAHPASSWTPTLAIGYIIYIKSFSTLNIVKKGKNRLKLLQISLWWPNICIAITNYSIILTT